MTEQEITTKSTNYLDPETFYNKFLFWLQRLDPFVNSIKKPPMSAMQFVWAAELQYGCGLRVSEMLNLEKKDFDLKHRILIIRNPKTAKGKIQKTTILPYHIRGLEIFLELFKDGDKIFPTSRQTIWKYYKNAGAVAGLNIFESQNERDIANIWTHLLRKSCSKRMQALGASRELRMRKLRHSFRDAHDAYDVVDLNTLLDWEAEHMIRDVKQ
jgi:integrase